MVTHPTVSTIVEGATCSGIVWFYLPQNKFLDSARKYHQGTLRLAENRLILVSDEVDQVWSRPLSEIREVRRIGTVITFYFYDGKFQVDFRDVRAAVKLLGPRGSPFALKGVGAGLTAMKPFLEYFHAQGLLEQSAITRWKPGLIAVVITVVVLIVSVVVGFGFHG